MKKLLILFLSFFVFPAYAVTSESYVDSAVNTLQGQISAENANTVLTNTGVAGEIDAKQIYDSTQSFVNQTDALVTAETFNTAVQNAIDNEFVCIEWLGEHVPGNCLLWQTRNTTPQQIIPNEYTQLEYIESTGKQYINTKIINSHKIQMGINLTKYTTDYSLLYGSQTAVSPVIRHLVVIHTNTGILQITAGTNNHESKVFSNDVFTTGVYHDLTVIVAETSKLTLDGSTAISETPGDNASPGLYDYLFCYNYGGQAFYRISAKMYFVKIWNSDNNLIRNFIPARRNSDGVLGMYDTVSGTFFTNAGAGEFIAGPAVNSNLYLPSGD